MPRIRQKAGDYARKDFLKAIDHAKVDAGIRTQRVIANGAGIPESSFSKLLQEPERITLGQLRRLVAVIPLPPEAVLAFVGYDLRTIRANRENRSEND